MWRAVTPNMGVRTGARRSYFVDPGLGKDPVRRSQLHLRQWGVRHGRIADPSQGTLNGIATAKTDACTLPVVSFSRMGAQVTLFLRGPCARRVPANPGRTTRCPATSSTLFGASGPAATGAAAVFRLVGTSAAAPQLARHLAKLWWSPSALPSRRPTFHLSPTS